MARKPEWQKKLDRQNEDAHAVVERMLMHGGAAEPGVLSQLIMYVLQTAHGDNQPYTVRELDEILRHAASRGRIPAAVVSAVEVHMARVEVL